MIYEICWKTTGMTCTFPLIKDNLTEKEVHIEACKGFNPDEEIGSMVVISENSNGWLVEKLTDLLFKGGNNVKNR